MEGFRWPHERCVSVAERKLGYEALGGDQGGVRLGLARGAVVIDMARPVRGLPVVLDPVDARGPGAGGAHPQASAAWRAGCGGAGRRSARRARLRLVARVAAVYRGGARPPQTMPRRAESGIPRAGGEHEPRSVSGLRGPAVRLCGGRARSARWLHCGCGGALRKGAAGLREQADIVAVCRLFRHGVVRYRAAVVRFFGAGWTG